MCAGRILVVDDDPDMRAMVAQFLTDTGYSVESAPDLRHPPAAPPVRFDDVMDGLKRLDGDLSEKPHCDHGTFIGRARRLKDLYRNEKGGRSLFA